MLDRIAGGEFRGYELSTMKRLKRFIPWEDEEDLLQEIRLWTVEAAQSFKPGPARFESFLYTHLRYRSWDLIRRERREKRRPLHGIVLLRHDPPRHQTGQSQLEICELLSSLSVASRRVVLRSLESHRRLKSTHAILELRRKAPKYLSGVGE